MKRTALQLSNHINYTLYSKVNVFYNSVEIKMYGLHPPVNPHSQNQNQAPKFDVKPALRPPPVEGSHQQPRNARRLGTTADNVYGKFPAPAD